MFLIYIPWKQKEEGNVPPESCEWRFVRLEIATCWNLGPCQFQGVARTTDNLLGDHNLLQVPIQQHHEGPSTGAPSAHPAVHHNCECRLCTTHMLTLEPVWAPLKTPNTSIQSTSQEPDHSSLLGPQGSSRKHTRCPEFPVSLELLEHLT